MRDIVRDERRSAGPKSARPAGVGHGRALGCVALLAGATSPCRATRLASALPWPIKEDQNHVIRLLPLVTRSKLTSIKSRGGARDLGEGR